MCKQIKINKAILLLFLFPLFCTITYGQAKNNLEKPSSVLAKFGELSLELVNDKIYLLIQNNTIAKDTILLKKIESNQIPLEGKIVPFDAKGTELYNVNWKYKTVTDTKLIQEEVTTIYTEICDIVLKTSLLSNVQTTIKTKETHILDTIQNSSETVQRTKNQGLMLNLTREGDVVLRNKNVEIKMIYDPRYKKYINSESFSQIKKSN